MSTQPEKPRSELKGRKKWGVGEDEVYSGFGLDCGAIAGSASCASVCKYFCANFDPEWHYDPLWDNADTNFLHGRCGACKRGEASNLTRPRPFPSIKAFAASLSAGPYKWDKQAGLVLLHVSCTIGGAV